MLKTLKLHNFRTYLNAEISFTRRHLIIGKNNSGKTNLCAALRFLSATAYSDLSTAAASWVPGGIGEIANWSVKSDSIEISCECDIRAGEQTCTYAYELALAKGTSPLAAFPSIQGVPSLHLRKETLSARTGTTDAVVLLRSDGQHVEVLAEGPYREQHRNQYRTCSVPADATALSKPYELGPASVLIAAFRDYLIRWLYFAPSPEAIRHGWRDHQRATSVLDVRGENLAVVLYHLKNADERRYRRVIDHVRLVEPDLEFVNFVDVPGQAPVPTVTLKNCPQHASWQGLSDGTLRCMALAVIAEAATVSGPAGQPGPSGTVVVIEEPENCIYPGLMRKFFEALEERQGETQFIFTSHSPYFINLFDAFRESVTLLSRNKERTEVRSIPPPDDDPDRLLLAEEYSMELFD